MTLNVTHVMPAQPGEEDTEWVKHVRVQSQKLTAFWGRPIYVYATLLLPKGYAEHPNTFGTRASTPSAMVRRSSSPRRRARNSGTVSPITGTESGYDFQKEWVSDSMPRFIAISLEQQTPVFS